MSFPHTGVYHNHLSAKRYYWIKNLKKFKERYNEHEEKFMSLNIEIW